MRLRLRLRLRLPQLFIARLTVFLIFHKSILNEILALTFVQQCCRGNNENPLKKYQKSVQNVNEIGAFLQHASYIGVENLWTHAQ